MKFQWYEGVAVLTMATVVMCLNFIRQRERYRGTNEWRIRKIAIVWCWAHFAALSGLAVAFGIWVAAVILLSVDAAIFAAASGAWLLRRGRTHPEAGPVLHDFGHMTTWCLVASLALVILWGSLVLTSGVSVWTLLTAGGPLMALLLVRLVGRYRSRQGTPI